jgi:outer membrane receptor protein involved in Fe transport
MARSTRATVKAVFGTHRAPSGTSLLEARSATRGPRRQESAERSAPTAPSSSSGCRACQRSPHLGGPADDLEHRLSDPGRQATNPQWQYPTVYNPKVNYTWTTRAHSFKSGYEMQWIDTEVQDVNPLYGRDTYNGSFTRPAGAAASNLYNLADFALGLRAQYALSSVLVAHLRRNMQFAYLQDDWRASSKLTLNLGLRYEYSTPYWEKDNVLSNYDPAANAIVKATDGGLRIAR